MVANQGLYKGFLVAMLIWGLCVTGDTALQFKILGLACVIAAGLCGTFTSSRRILFVQVPPMYERIRDYYSNSLLPSFPRATGTTSDGPRRGRSPSASAGYRRAFHR